MNQTVTKRGTTPAMARSKIRNREGLRGLRAGFALVMLAALIPASEALAQAAAAAAAAPAQAPAAAAAPAPQGSSDSSKTIKVTAGPPSSAASGAWLGGASSYLVEVGLSKAKVLDVHYPFEDLMIADAKVADVIPLSNHSIYIVAKGLGSTSLSVYGAGKRLIAAVNVVVGPDAEGFKARLHEILPEETDVAVRSANDSMVLSGTVTSPAALHQVVQLAESYAPGKVVNMLGVEGTQQVMLSVRFVEMDRSTAKNLNVTMTGFNNNNPSLAGAMGPAKNLTGNNADLTKFLVPANSYGALSAVINRNIGLEIDALETKGMVRTLAEPTLVTMSGDAASFLAGGEIPIPTAQAGGTGAAAISVDYKDFGISLGFTPTILKNGLINLVVKPEVSSLDPSAGVTEGGFTIPGLKVRRAYTTVELRDGESFTIAGLLSDTYQNAISQFPFLGDVPVLGSLFRSPNFQQNKTELVIVVTPHLVTARKGPVALPSDHFTPPSDYELFLFGSLSGNRKGVSAEDRALMSRDPSKGGIDGPYGHVLY